MSEADLRRLLLQAASGETDLERRLALSLLERMVLLERAELARLRGQVARLMSGSCATLSVLDATSSVRTKPE